MFKGNRQQVRQYFQSVDTVISIICEISAMTWTLITGLVMCGEQNYSSLLFLSIKLHWEKTKSCNVEILFILTLRKHKVHCTQMFTLSNTTHTSDSDDVSVL